jgi:SAM-dependent methyltransferase
VKCRYCGSDLSLPFIDLGSAPPSNSYLTSETLWMPENWCPLRVLVCTGCWLVQTEDYAGREALFDSQYAYFSSYSSTWLAHAERYVAGMTERFGLSATSNVVEVAANDGYLLQYVQARGIPCYGIEPTTSTAAAARAKGLEILEAFFGIELAERLASQCRLADLIVANNVLAHVPDINDFVAGFSRLLKPAGVATFEFPHLLRLVLENQFDTIYHEHFSYLALSVIEPLFAGQGLKVFDVEELPTHGGSLRVYACHGNNAGQPRMPSVDSVLARERDAGMGHRDFYTGLQGRAEAAKHDLLSFLLEARRNRKKIGAYGAAAKGNTLLNFAGVRPDLLPWVADLNPAKQGKFLPGSRIPIIGEARIREERPDYILILPWNLRDEVSNQLAYARHWGASFVTAIPELRID